MRAIRNGSSAKEAIVVLIISLLISALCVLIFGKKRDPEDWRNNYLPKWYKSNKWFCYIAGSAIIVLGIVLSVIDIIKNGFSSTTIIVIVMSMVVGAHFIFDLSKGHPAMRMLLGDISEEMEEKLQEQKKVKQQSKMKTKNKKQCK